jgi:SAM-dependent methyltransferase
MFTQSAEIYDLIYSWKDYTAEAEKVRAMIDTHKLSAGRALLDVACGTGRHLELLKPHFDVEGLDLDDALLTVARRRIPGVTFHQGDMLSFALGRAFDAITCLFSSIGYMKTLDGLHQAVGTMAAHLERGGVLLVEPWFGPGVLTLGTGNLHCVTEGEVKVARISVMQVEGAISLLDFHHMVGTPEGVQYFSERHEMGLFTREQYEGAFAAASLDGVYDEQGISGRGLYLGVRPL